MLYKMASKRNIKNLYEEKIKVFNHIERLLAINQNEEDNLENEQNKLEEDLDKLRIQKVEETKKIKNERQRVKKEIEFDKKIEKLIEQKIKNFEKKERLSKEKLKLLSEINIVKKEVNEISQQLKKIEEKEKLYKKMQEAKQKEKEKKENEKKKEEEKKKLNELLERQKQLRNEEEDAKKNKSEDNNEKLKHILEDMCILGDITKNQILKEKDNKDKYISIEETRQLKQKPSPTEDDEALFCLGVLAQNLEDKGISTLIERNKNSSDENNQESNTTLDFLFNGLMDKSKYAFNFDFGEKMNNKLLTDEKEQKTFNDKLLKKISSKCGVPENEILVTYPQKGSYIVHVIFLSEQFDNLDPEQLKNLVKLDKDFKEISYLKKIQKKVIMDGVKLTRDMLDYRGNKTPDGYPTGQKRGTYDYIPPTGWKGFGLKVLDKYDQGNNNWLAMDGNPEEWAVAYHGIGRQDNNVEEIAGKIVKGGFKIGNCHKLAKYDDINHPGKKIGIGIYVSPKIKYIEENGYVGKSNTVINGKRFKMAFMLRVKPDGIRACTAYPDEWVLAQDEIRPYRIILKEE
jgi:hypothetical protein